MENRQMSVVRKAEAEAACDRNETSIIHAAEIRGEGTLNLLCGGCRHVVASEVSQGQFVGAVLVCQECGAYNQTLD